MGSCDAEALKKVVRREELRNMLVNVHIESAFQSALLFSTRR